MANFIEEKLKKCETCSRTTTHQRNNTKSTGFMLLVHLVLSIITAGVWFVCIVSWKLMNLKFGGWVCIVCGSEIDKWGKSTKPQEEQ